MLDVAAHRIVRCGAVAILVLHPEGIVGNVGPTMVVRIGKAAVAWKAERKIDVAVLAGDAAVAVIAVEQILDDQLWLRVDVVHLPNFFAVFGNVGLAVLGTVADLVHHRREGALADLAQQLAILVEDFDVRWLELVGFGAAEKEARNRHPEVAVFVQGCRGGSIQPGFEHAYFVTGWDFDLARIWLHRFPFHPLAGHRFLGHPIRCQADRYGGSQHDAQDDFHGFPPWLCGYQCFPRFPPVFACIVSVCVKSDTASDFPLVPVATPTCTRPAYLLAGWLRS